MKKIYIHFLILLWSFPGSALIIESGYIQQNNGSFVKATQIACDAEDGNSCVDICQKQDQCVRVEPYCRSCAGTSSPLLRQLFTEISKLYKIKGKITDKSAWISYLAKESYILLDLKSVYNYYTPIGSESFVKELSEFCGLDTENSLLAITLDSLHQPQELKYIFCRAQGMKTEAFEVEERTPHREGHRIFQVPLIFDQQPI